MIYTDFNLHVVIEDIRIQKNIHLLHKMFPAYAPSFPTFFIYLQEKHSNHCRCLLKRKVMGHKNIPVLRGQVKSCLKNFFND